jgi:RNA polymerase I-specific transcription initiation factor RRN3
MCSPSVVHQFARLARKLNFLYVYTIIERNKQLYLPRRQNNSRLSLKSAAPELDAFFPFDPYRLTRSGHHVGQLYKEWQPDSDADEEEDADDEEENEEENKTGTFGDDMTSEFLENSLDDPMSAMSISPQGRLLDAQRRALLFSND